MPVAAPTSLSFADLVAVSATVAATGSRLAKVAAIADGLRATASHEVAAAVGFLTGQARQGAIGVGWATLVAVDPPSAGQPSLAVAEVDLALSDLAATTGAGSNEARRARLDALFRRATPAEAGFVRDLLTGQVRQGALAGVMADAVARAAGVPIAAVRRAAMLSGDLGATAAAALTGGADALAAVGLTLLRPVQPMLASTATDLAEALSAVGTASVEWKLDGARVQVHRRGDEVRVFTRNLNDVTDRLAGVVATARALPAERFVLDGEVLDLGEASRPRPFQETMRRFGRHRPDPADATGVGGGGATLAAVFFDLLHVDGDDLIDRRLDQRLARLDDLVGELAVPRVVTASIDEAGELQATALARGHEGVVVKAIGSTYEAGRRGGSWRKVKPVRTLDLVVLAAEWGHGRRQGRLSNLHLGARAAATGEPGFVMVGKTFKGLTDELLAWQTAELLARRVAEHGITVEVRPELVVEIALDGAQASTRYPGGVALRFARVRRYRPDKDPSEADTIDAVRATLAAVDGGTSP